MRCKHGDLAIIVKDFEGCEGNLGLIVKVVGPAEHHPDTELICWQVIPLSRRKMWIADEGVAQHVYLSKKFQALHPAPWLLPIRGQVKSVENSAELIEYI
jgi:hypothetical protein